MKRTEAERLLDILESIAAIQRNETGDRAAFDNSEVLRGFIQKHLEIIGEAASKISPETRERAAGVSWKAIVNMRNRLVHDYAYVDWNIVWDVVRTELAPLRAAVESLVRPG